jgi:hypothetical protein
MIDHASALRLMRDEGPEYLWDEMFPVHAGALARYIPKYMRDGMVMWVAFGIRPGSFLTSVLQNDLIGAAMAADNLNRPRLHDYAAFLIGHVPALCYGTPAKVAVWRGCIVDRPMLEQTGPARAARPDDGDPK